MPGGTIRDCLASIGIPLAGLHSSGSLNEEWQSVKKAYFKKILTCHPDKGGDAAVFREVQTSFEVLRKVFDASVIKSFVEELDRSTADLYRGTKEDLKGASTPSWEYYAEAAKEVRAPYRVELARSSRSRCQAQGTKKKCTQDPPFIEKGALRVGFMLQSGGYGLWVHLECWRVPSRIWLGLPNPDKIRDRRQFERALVRMNEVSLCGMLDLEKADRKKVARHVMDKKHWTFEGVADKVRQRVAPPSQAGGEGGRPGGAGNSSSKEPGTSLVAAGKQKERFVVPEPGRGAPPGSLAGQTFVITGIFPEVGGGDGLQLGKERVKKMICSFGGKVTGSVSGKTDVLVVGKDPGMGKVGKARRNPKTRLLSLHDIKVGLERGSLEEAKAAKPMLIKSFSKGFAQRRGGPNSLALTASQEDLAIASGTAAPAIDVNATGRRGANARKRPASASPAANKSRRR